MAEQLSHQLFDPAWGAKPVRETQKTPVFEFLRQAGKLLRRFLRERDEN